MVRTLVGFYGDDFTGSSENLAQFRRAGLRARLFLRPLPFERFAEAARGLHVAGFAGTTRAMPAGEIAREMIPALELLAQLTPRLLQYKICSTFDSSPTIGSFGQAMAAARRVFPGCALPVLPAVPDFGRYTAFGQHFARFGSDIMRLDRHPSMTAHPSTPMHEADLRLHLGRQTDIPFVNLMLPTLGRPAEARRATLEAFAEGSGVVFDCVDDGDLDHIAALLWEISAEQRVFALAAQGLPQRLAPLLAGQLPRAELVQVGTALPKTDRLLVLSGSCAQQTARQIGFAEGKGWFSVRLDTAGLADPAEREREIARLVAEARKALAQGRPTIVYSARGTQDRAAAGEVSASVLGATFAAIARQVRQSEALRRIVFAGGDSSSYSVRALGADALEVDVYDEHQASHLCRLVGGDAVDGLEVMLKGGQVGADDYFLHAMSGHLMAEAVSAGGFE